MAVADYLQEQVDAQTPPGVEMISMEDAGRPMVEKLEGNNKDEESPPPEEAPPEEKQDEVEDATGNLMERLGYKAREEGEKAPTEEVQGEAEETPTEVEEKPKRKRGRPKKEESLSADDIKDIIRETATSVASVRTGDTPEPVPGYDEVEELNKGDLEVFGQLEEKDSKYKGIREKYKSYLGDLGSYKAAWTAENPGQEFDTNDAEHEEWIGQNLPKFDERDFDDARIETRAKRMLKDSERKYMNELDSVRSEVAEANMKGELEQGTNNSVAEVVSSIDEGYLKMIQESGGEALEQADPIAHHVLNETLAESEKTLYELEKLAHPSRKFRLNMENDVHKGLVQFALSKEKQISALPQSQQLHEGKRFATTEQWMKMPESKRDGHWHLEPGHIKTMYVSDISNKAKNRIDSERERFERYSSKKTGKKSSQPSVASSIISPRKSTKPQPPETSRGDVTSTATGDTAKTSLGDLPTLKKFLWG
jgi:hypothetical protein